MHFGASFGLCEPPDLICALNKPQVDPKGSDDDPSEWFGVPSTSKGQPKEVTVPGRDGTSDTT